MCPGAACALAQIFTILGVSVVLIFTLLQKVQETTNLYLPYQRRQQVAEAEKRKKEGKEAKKQNDKRQKLCLEIETISKFGKLLEGLDTPTAFYDESLLPCAKKGLELLLIKHIRERTKELTMPAHGIAARLQTNKCFVEAKMTQILTQKVLPAFMLLG
ncbi:hypothetical protein N8Z70_00450 [Candidatus Puniceispirillum sp.]|nr:hypothetical protein [Candidatus Puniceispirillum sp.]